jgi:hypothetical protein
MRLGIEEIVLEGIMSFFSFNLFEGEPMGFNLKPKTPRPSKSPIGQGPIASIDDAVKRLTQCAHCNGRLVVISDRLIAWAKTHDNLLLCDQCLDKAEAGCSTVSDTNQRKITL